MQTIGRGVKYQMKFGSYGSNPLQCAPQQRSQVAHARRPAKTEPLEGGFMAAWNDPGLVRHARRIRTEGDKVTPHFQQTPILIQFLGNDVAKYAAFLGFEVVSAGTQFIEHPAWDERGCREL